MHCLMCLSTFVTDTFATATTQEPDPSFLFPICKKFLSHFPGKVSRTRDGNLQKDQGYTVERAGWFGH
jgi:hypothetical protein